MVSEIIGKISKGTLMDQVYIPKNRPLGFEIGSYVAIAPAVKKPDVAPYHYNVSKIAPIKSSIINEIFLHEIGAKNVIITGSFLNEGFMFRDIDIIVIGDKQGSLEKFIKDSFGLDAHIILISYEALREGLNTDPLFQMMLDRFVAKEKVLFKIRPIINYKLLDLHLLKSKILIENFDLVNGQEKYKLTRNVIAIRHFIEGKKISLKGVDVAIKNLFGKESISQLSENMLEREKFIKEYKKLYGETFNLVMEGIQHGAKQAKNN